MFGSKNCLSTFDQPPSNWIEIVDDGIGGAGTGGGSGLRGLADRIEQLQHNGIDARQVLADLPTADLDRLLAAIPHFAPVPAPA